ncbi:MAG: biotin/lipoyl-binding protein [Clostridia bacterium]|nr:biotin/lipoyl-binding protein [Clostridia bacterium]
MKKYKVNVNGTDYEIAVELIGEAEAKTAPAQEAPKAAPAPVANGEGEKVEAPMPGNILDIKVAVGDSVKKGQVLVILEAMKMENEIMAGVDGTVTSIVVTKGSTVEAGTTLLTIK